MKNWIRKFERKSVKQKRNIKLSNNGVLKHNKSHTIHCTMSDEELRQFLLKHQITTLIKLEEINKHIPESPSFQYIRSRYGKWSVLRDQVFDSLKTQVCYDDWYKLYVHFGVYTYTQAKKARKKYPKIFPTPERIQYHFGSWENFKRILVAHTYSDIVKRFIEFKKQLGRTPTHKECRKAGIDLFNLIPDVFASYHLFKKFILTVEDVYED